MLLIHKVNIDLQEELNRKANSNASENEEVTISDCEDDDDESVAFNMMQTKNRFKRTLPMTEAVNSRQTDLNHLKCKECGYKANDVANLRGHITGHNNLCETCGSKFKTAGLLRQHMQREHVGGIYQTHNNNPEQNTNQSGDLPCKKCDFIAKTRIKLKKHEVVRHSSVNPGISFIFWQRGMCRPKFSRSS